MQLLCYNDVNAFNELYSRYNNRILYYFYRMLGNDKEKSQDFLQDIFMKVVEKPHMFNPKQKFTTWIFSIAHNMCKNEYRKLEVRKIIETYDTIENFCITNEEFNIDLNDFTKELYTELETMDEDHKTAFLLKYREGFQIKEISKVLNCAEGTVKSRIFNVNKKLAGRLSKFKTTI